MADLKSKIIHTLEARPGLTVTSLGKLVKAKPYQVQKVISELVGSGMVMPRPKGSHNGLILVKK